MNNRLNSHKSGEYCFVINPCIWNEAFGIA